MSSLIVVAADIGVVIIFSVVEDSFGVVSVSVGAVAVAVAVIVVVVVVVLVVLCSGVKTF